MLLDSWRPEIIFKQHDAETCRSLQACLSAVSPRGVTLWHHDSKQVTTRDDCSLTTRAAAPDGLTNPDSDWGWFNPRKTPLEVGLSSKHRANLSTRLHDGAAVWWHTTMAAPQKTETETCCANICVCAGVLGQAVDRDRWKSLRTSGGQVENTTGAGALES